MFVRTSERGEPAKINFCRLRTDSVENSPDSPFAGAKSFAVDCTGLSMKRPSLRCEVRLLHFQFQYGRNPDGLAKSLTNFWLLLQEAGGTFTARRIRMGQAQAKSLTTSGRDRRN